MAKAFSSIPIIVIDMSFGRKILKVLVCFDPWQAKNSTQSSL